MLILNNTITEQFFIYRSFGSEHFCSETIATFVSNEQTVKYLT